MIIVYPCLSPLMVLLVGHALCVPIIPQISDEEDIVEVELNSLDGAIIHYSKEIIDLSRYGSAMFGEPDAINTGNMVANYSAEASNVNPEELGSYLEGDILLPKQKGVTLKNGLVSQSSRWPQGIVPYDIRGNFNARDMSIIENAIAEYHSSTCIRFVPRTSENDYISIVSGNSGCWSSVGRVGGKQEVNLQSPGCLSKPGTPLHELMHALGFLHEQNREERDSFVHIQYENISPSATSNFEKASKTLAFSVPYDYGSVMHYSANAFSTNGRPTIVPVRSMGSVKMGQRDGFSKMDIEKLNRMYDCGYHAVSSSTTVQGGNAAVLPTGGASGIEYPLISSFVNGIITGLGFDVKLPRGQQTHDP